MPNKTYYINGNFHEEDELIKDNLRKKRRKRSIILSSILCVIILLIVLLKTTVYTEQYFWSNDLIMAIDCGDIKQVGQLLKNEDMDVNERGGDIFPFCYVFDEFYGSVPVELAFFRQDTRIIKMLFERGAKADANELLRNLAESGYSPDLCKCKNLLDKYVEDTNQKYVCNEDVFLYIAYYMPSYEANIWKKDAKQIEHEITGLYIELYEKTKDSTDADTLRKILVKSLNEARDAENISLERFLLKEFKKYE